MYVRASYPDGTVRTTLAVVKAIPAPTKQQTIPQLELRTAVLGPRVSCKVGNVIGIPVENHTFWSDLMNTIGWVKAHSQHYKVDIGNQISELQSLTKAHQWRRVPRKKNPVDKSTRGCQQQLSALLPSGGLCPSSSQSLLKNGLLEYQT